MVIRYHTTALFSELLGGRVGNGYFQMECSVRKVFLLVTPSLALFMLRTQMVVNVNKMGRCWGLSVKLPPVLSIKLKLKMGW